MPKDKQNRKDYYQPDRSPGGFQVTDIARKSSVSRASLAVLGVKEYSSSRRKYFAFGWRFVLGLFLCVFFITGLTPLDLARKSLDAFIEEEETIALYANSCFAPGSSGWHRAELAQGAPKLGPQAQRDEFTGLNSAVGQVSGSIACRGFDLLYADEEKSAAYDADKNAGDAHLTPADQVENEPDDRQDSREDAATSSPAAIASSSPSLATSSAGQASSSGEQTFQPQQDPDKPENSSSSDELELKDSSQEPANGTATEATSSVSRFISASAEAYAWAGNYLNKLDRPPAARAQDFVADGVKHISDLGTLNKASVKLSLAFYSQPAVNGANEPDPTNDDKEVNGTASGTRHNVASSSDSMASSTVSAPAAAGTTTEATGTSTDAEASGAEGAPDQDEKATSTQEAETGNGTDPGPDNPEKESEEEGTGSQASSSEVSLLNGREFWNRFFLAQEAKADTAGGPSSGLVVWYSLDKPASSTGKTASGSANRIWRKLKTIDAREFSNYLNNGYLELEAPFLSNWQDVSDLELRVEAARGDASEFSVFVDSMWVEADYEPGAEVERIRKRQAFEKALELLSRQTVFQISEDARLSFHYTKKKRNLLERVESLFGVESFWQNVELEAALKDPAGRKLDVPLTIIFEDDGTFTVEVPGGRGDLRPGKYSVVFRIKDKSVEPAETLEIEQEFSWGVLAVNTDRSVYRPGEAGYIQAAVLDETGHTLCNAELEMVIKSPRASTTRLTTADGSIKRNPECGPNNVIDSPDYYVYHQFHELGKYEIQVTAHTANGQKQMAETVEVRPDPEIRLKRTGPTRIYPKADYTMEIALDAVRGYQGEFKESIPGSFSLVEQAIDLKAASGSERIGFRTEQTEGGKQLIWSGLDLQAGEGAKFRYTFDAPDISPEFYLLGPAELDDYTERRAWQIAADALGEYTARDGTGINWTDPGLAWDATDDTYAYRDIPAGGSDDSANYLLATSTEASGHGGTITQVEIGVEGYAASTTVSAYLAPVFEGAATGSAYQISGEALGTTDDDSLNYADITLDSQAPAEWTWQDVMDLDIMAYGHNTDAGQSQRLYIDQLSVKVTYNAPPTGEMISAEQKRDGSGTVDITIRADDPEDDDLRAKVEYEAGGDCAFISTSSPALDETDSSVTADYGDPVIDNSLKYQVGTTSGWIITSSGANQVYFDWLSALDIPAADGEYCLRTTLNDRQNDQITSATSSLIIDNTDPVAPGNLEFGDSSNSSLTLAFGSQAADSHFAEYRIYYKQASSGVTEEDNLHGSSTDPDLGYVDYNGAAGTTISGLATGTQYSFNIWAYDEYGNRASAEEVDFYTNRRPAPAEALAQYRSDATTTIGSGEWTSEDSVVLEAEATDQDPDEQIVLYFELKPDNQAFTTATTVPASCASTTPYSECSSGIWAATSTAGDYSSTGFRAKVAPGDIPDSQEGYKWQVMACDQNGLCADWAQNGGSPDFRVDHTAPTAPGDLAIAGRATTSVKLGFGASTTEKNFREYIIYYKQGQSGATEADQMHASGTDPNLGAIGYNQATSTTITGLEQGTDYVFNIYAYDLAGNTAAATREASTTTVTLPQGSFNSAELRRDGSGRADISIEVSDQDGDDTRAKLEYAAGADCDFSSSGDPTLDESDASVAADYGDPVIDNNQAYQIGSTSGWIVTDSGSNTVEFDWLAGEDIPDSEGVYCLRLTVTDGIYEQAVPATTTLMIDTQAPAAPGSLSAAQVTQQSVTLDFGSASSDANFSEYKIFYKEGVSGAGESDSLFGSSSDPSLGYPDYNGVATTTVDGLTINTDYVFNIWAYDDYGNRASATEEVVASTSYTPASQVWRWYHDEASSTPQFPVGSEEEAPNTITGGNVLKLRMAISEEGGVIGQGVKMRLQYSQYSDFSQDVHFVGEAGSSSPWTYGDGVDEDNDPIEATLLTTSEAGATHNESGLSTTDYDHPASTTAEWEFTIKNNGAASSTTFYFRAWDRTDNLPIAAGDGYSYPSLVTSAGSLTYGVGGLSAGSTTEGVVTTVDAVTGEVSFGSLAAGDEAIGAQRFNISTNAESGYQLFVYQKQDLLAENGARISPVSFANDNPSAWPEDPDPSAFGYHTGDDTLSGRAPSRFAADNTYARFEGNFKEISYSPLPVQNEVVDFVYRVGVSGMQEAGDYVTEIVYILVPTF